jgi:hypothetical protein
MIRGNAERVRYLGVDDLAEAAEGVGELALVGVEREAAHEDPAVLLARHCRRLCLASLVCGGKIRVWVGREDDDEVVAEGSR